ncbi:ATP-binding protein [Streptomyces sp. SCUT-3]|uniref:ATP-binding protein n=1 Tax=Streptomyces sp. SCUT-3 TaxID=2684469 RepID=UPI0015FE77A3|nr:ATP-binding protein [Streptomyces sp. SCUT-3]
MYIPFKGRLRPARPHGLDARLAVRPVAGGRRVAVPLPGDDPASARAARRIVRHRLAVWGVPGEPADDLVLITGELAANALTHAVPPQAGGRRLWVVVGRHPGAVLVAVVDNGVYDPGPLRPRTPDDTACSGRGLYIVAGLSDRWGHLAHPLGTCVWAARDRPAGPSGPSGPSAGADGG